MDKMKGRAIYGVAIGDAVGVPYEFKERGSFICTDMTGYGTYNKPIGTWSDDTAMTIATEDSLRQNDGWIDTMDMFLKFRRWLCLGEYTVDGTFDVGGTTSKSLETGEPGRSEYDNGNGSLMRMIPLAFTDCTDEEIREVSAITHGHEISKEACVIYVNIARKLISGGDKNDLLVVCEGPFDRLRYLDKLEESDIYSDGYVVHTLEAALWSVYHSYNFRDAILKAVNLGYDTDTTAAVAGGLAGILYSLDEEWFEMLRGKSVIDKACGF